MISLYWDFYGVSLLREHNGSSRSYSLLRCLKWAAQFGCSHRYFQADILQFGKSLCLDSTRHYRRGKIHPCGRSPVIKWIDGVGAVMLSLRINFKVLLWNIARGSNWVDLSENEDRPDLVLRQVNVLHRWSLRTRLIKHLNENAEPSKLKRDFLPFSIFKSIFFSSWFLRLTICPRCSLLSTTCTFFSSIVSQLN